MVRCLEMRMVSKHVRLVLIFLVIIWALITYLEMTPLVLGLLTKVTLLLMVLLWLLLFLALLTFLAFFRLLRWHESLHIDVQT